MLIIFPIAYAKYYQQQQKNISFTGMKRATILQYKNTKPNCWEEVGLTRPEQNNPEYPDELSSIPSLIQLSKIKSL